MKNNLSDKSNKKSYWKEVFNTFISKRINIFLLAILAIIIVFSFVYPLFAGYDRMKNIMDAGAKHLSPGEALSYFGVSIHWVLGTGASGESTFDALWCGARVSILISLICAVINIVAGVFIGIFCGLSRRLDSVFIEIRNILGNVPYILLVSVILSSLKGGFKGMIVALTVIGWVSIAYYVRTQVVIIRDMEYNLASRCMGTPVYRIAIHNILPKLTSVITLLFAAEIPACISFELFFSYIGIGIKDMSLGRMIYEAESSMFVPGRMIEFWSPVVLAAVISASIYILGQNFADASDPKTHF